MFVTNDPLIDLQLLGRFPVFRGMSQEQIGRFAPQLHRHSFNSGQYVVLSEQPGEAVYFIISGALKIQAGQVEGDDMILAILGPGDVVGEMSLFGDYRGRSANVISMIDSVLLWMDPRTFQTLLETMPNLSRNLMYILSDRLRLANEQLRSFATLDVQGRVARQLLLLVRQFGVQQDDGSVLISLRITQSDLAALVGASRERVNQSLGRVKQQHMLSVDSVGQIVIQKPAALAELCRGYLSQPSDRRP